MPKIFNLRSSKKDDFNIHFYMKRIKKDAYLKKKKLKKKELARKDNHLKWFYNVLISIYIKIIVRT